MGQPLAHRSEGAFFFFFSIHSFSLLSPQGPDDVRLRFQQSCCAETVRVVSRCAARMKRRELACNAQKKKRGKEREREKEISVTVAVVFFLKGQSCQMTGLPPPEGGGSNDLKLGRPFFFLFLHLFCYYHLFSFLKKYRVIATPLPTLPIDTLYPLTNLVSL